MGVNIVMVAIRGSGEISAIAKMGEVGGGVGLRKVGDSGRIHELIWGDPGRERGRGGDLASSFPILFALHLSDGII